jgi:hypothetical protein
VALCPHEQSFKPFDLRRSSLAIATLAISFLELVLSTS